MNIPDTLYRQICGVMPIPCVDLLVTDPLGHVLLVERKNEPAAGQWWFPGGRVHLNETRQATALRKLKEECNLEPTAIKEIGTFDVILEANSPGVANHGITTLFQMRVSETEVQLDNQSRASSWRLPFDWAEEDLHPIVREWLAEFEARQGQ